MSDGIGVKVLYIDLPESVERYHKRIINRTGISYTSLHSLDDIEGHESTDPDDLNIIAVPFSLQFQVMEYVKDIPRAEVLLYSEDTEFNPDPLAVLIVEKVRNYVNARCIESPKISEMAALWKQGQVQPTQ